MWIRSQDLKMLKDCKEIYIRECKGSTYIIGDCIELGKYSTEEKAMEILNEIESILMNMNTLYLARQGYRDISRTDYIEQINVYQMPREIASNSK